MKKPPILYALLLLGFLWVFFTTPNFFQLVEFQLIKIPRLLEAYCVHSTIYSKSIYYTIYSYIYSPAATSDSSIRPTGSYVHELDPSENTFSYYCAVYFSYFVEEVLQLQPYIHTVVSNLREIETHMMWISFIFSLYMLTTHGVEQSNPNHHHSHFHGNYTKSNVDPKFTKYVNFKTGLPRVVFISASFGTYEKRLKPIVNQTVPYFDQIMFTDVKHNQTYGWTLDHNQYHLHYKSKFDTGNEYNSLKKNAHPFNVAKYYKQQFQNIPRIRLYDVVIWLDASIEINNPYTVEWSYAAMVENKTDVALFVHEFRGGSLQAEIVVSLTDLKYTRKNWLGIDQPVQPIGEQYQAYLSMGYNESFWPDVRSTLGITNPNVCDVYEAFIYSR